jgi:hypothetical protein
MFGRWWMVDGGYQDKAVDDDAVDAVDVDASASPWNALPPWNVGFGGMWGQGVITMTWQWNMTWNMTWHVITTPDTSVAVGQGPDRAILHP